MSGIDGLGGLIRAGIDGIQNLGGQALKAIQNFMKGPMEHPPGDAVGSSNSAPITDPGEQLAMALTTGRGWTAESDVQQKELDPAVKVAVNDIVSKVKITKNEREGEGIDFTTELDFEEALPIMEKFVKENEPETIASAASALAKADPRIGAEMLSKVPTQKQTEIAKAVVSNLDLDTAALLVEQTLTDQLAADIVKGTEGTILRGTSLSAKLTTAFMNEHLGPQFKEGLGEIFKNPGSDSKQKVLDLITVVLNPEGKSEQQKSVVKIVQKIGSQLNSQMAQGKKGTIEAKQVATTPVILRFVVPQVVEATRSKEISRADREELLKVVTGLQNSVTAKGVERAEMQPVLTALGIDQQQLSL